MELLSQITGKLNLNSSPELTQVSGIVGEVADDGSIHPELEISASERRNSIKQQVGESLVRLSQLVDEKERTFDNFDQDQRYQAIIDDLKQILNAATRYATAVVEDKTSSTCSGCRSSLSGLCKHLKRFNTGFGSDQLSVNSNGKLS